MRDVSLGGGPASAALALVLAGGLTLGARISLELPGAAVPQTAQTLLLVLIAACVGPKVAVAGAIFYLVMGALGAPVFAGGAAGVQHLVGPGGGFLVGFVLAAALVSWEASRGRAWAALRLVLVMVGAHLVILALGWARLTVSIGAERAYEVGVAPFVVGGLVKSALAAAMATILRWALERLLRRQASSGAGATGPARRSWRARMSRGVRADR